MPLDGDILGDADGELELEGELLGEEDGELEGELLGKLLGDKDGELLSAVGLLVGASDLQTESNSKKLNPNTMVLYILSSHTIIALLSSMLSDILHGLP